MSQPKDVKVELWLSDRTWSQLRCLAKLFHDGDENACLVEVVEWYISELKAKGIAPVEK